MRMLIWKNIARRRTQSALTIAITMLTVMVFVMVLGVFQTVNQGLALSRERMGADAVLIPKYATADGGDLLFTAIPENIYMPAEVIEQAKMLEGIAAGTNMSRAEILRGNIAQWACKAAVKGGDDIPREEIEALVSNMLLYSRLH